MSASLTDRILREIQAEMRPVRDENKLIREELDAKASRGELLGVLQALADRIAAFEAAALTHLDQKRAQRPGAARPHRDDAHRCRPKAGRLM